jgi:putative transferase (TIGR04331 family)
MKRLLVTTSLEESWGINDPILFLGEWCKKHDRKHIWSSKDYILLPPYGLDCTQRKKDVDKKNKYFASLLTELSALLNKFHNVDRSERYWNIIIGPWLNSYLMVVMNRYKALEYAVNTYDISETILLKQHGWTLTPNNYVESRYFINSDLWNNNLYVDILKNTLKPDVNLTKIPVVNKKAHKIINASFYSKKSILKRKIISLLSNLTRYLKKDSDSFIINSYLPIIDEVKLQLLLGQFPQKWNTPKIKDIKPDIEFRKSFKLPYEEYDGIEREVRRLVNKLIPTCYVEGYEFLRNEITKLPWPKKPRFIFTSNAFSSNEVFKIWTAEKTENGVPYYIGQHGANYGTFYDSKTWAEINTPDKFFSWGWNDGYVAGQCVKAFNFKIINRSSSAYDKNGGSLLIQRGPGARDGVRDRFYEHICDHNDAMQLYRMLPELIKQLTIVRLHHGVAARQSSDQITWNENFDNIKIDNGIGRLDDLIKKNRVLVFNYDSAGVLENMALNIPTICFWRGNFCHLLPSAKPYYQLLKDVGIYFDTPEQASKHISSNWNNMDAWWYSKKVQDARVRFCDRYSRVVENPISYLKNRLVMK